MNKVTKVNKSFYRRSARRSRKRRFIPTERDLYERPRLDPQLRPVFRQIGVPEPTPFKPDPFQLEALELIKDYDVLVSAPTGAGKTWIASQAIHSYLTENLRVWYASPLKALSNSIYQEFCHEFGPSTCGILTGDRKENPDAPIIVGTTEILRNQLYDAMHEGTDIRSDLVILDEAHYLSDPDRGVVWEEVLIYLPSRVRLLLLSATVSNAEEVCAWLKKIRETSNRVVRMQERPVSLETLFLFPDGLIVPLGGKRGLNARIKKFLSSYTGRRRGRPQKLNFGNIINCLREFDLLPAIFFLKSRKDCDHALETCSSVKTTPEARNKLKRRVRTFLKDFPHLDGHRQIKALLVSRVGSHHGGQLPYWKVLIEKMMRGGYLEAIFSTSTVAAGVNFPARTVVLVQSDRFNGHEFVDLTATDLHQMIGRAGRRGKDRIGFALVVSGPHQDPKLIHELQNSSPEPILSQIHINFSMTLNLLLSHTPLEVKDLLDRSFATFQGRKAGASAKGKQDEMGGVLWTGFKRHVRFLKETGFVDETDRLTSDGYWASKLRLDQPLLIAEAIRKGSLNNVSPEVLAGGLAPFLWDREQEVELRTKKIVDINEMEIAFERLVDCIKQIRAVKRKRGFENPPILFWPAAAVYMWARGVSWERLLEFVQIDEGDMASLIMRSADHLRQVINLRETHSQLAS
ncbi:MAG: DEAD/DEAH box helicase, partial [Deltaproteobacteria bacterium]|nr:DEAD/DEAH box helicase [Deltaproteobacteria bacterium]